MEIYTGPWQGGGGGGAKRQDNLWGVSVMKEKY
jgi:hypothetical protein